MDEKTLAEIMETVSCLRPEPEKKTPADLYDEQIQLIETKKREAEVARFLDQQEKYDKIRGIARAPRDFALYKSINREPPPEAPAEPEPEPETKDEPLKYRKPSLPPRKNPHRKFLITVGDEAPAEPTETPQPSGLPRARAPIKSIVPIVRG